MKKLCSLILCVILICASIPPALAAENLVFSSLAYLTEGEAASRLAYYTGIPQQSALSKVKAAVSKASAGAGMLGARMSPAYIYLQTDIGSGKLLEQGAIVIVCRKNGKLEFTEVVGAYSRPVNSDLRWTPNGAATAAVSDKTQLTLSAAGTASVTLTYTEDGADQPLLDAGFVPAADGHTYNKQVALSSAYLLTETIPLNESDIARGYIAMFDLFAQTTKQNLKDYPRIGLELKTPVGLSATSKRVLLESFQETNGAKAIETTMEEYFAAQVSNQIADALFVIGNVTVSGNTIRFDIGGHMGQVYTILNNCMVQRGRTAGFPWKRRWNERYRKAIRGGGGYEKKGMENRRGMRPCRLMPFRLPRAGPYAGH